MGGIKPGGLTLQGLAPQMPEKKGDFIMKNIVMLLTLLIVFAVTSCDNSGGESDSKKITGFVFVSPAATGTINEAAKTISVIVPNDTNITNLTPVVTHTGASYGPTGAQDFTNVITYTITAEDGTQQNYMVTITSVTEIFNISGLAQLWDGDPKTVEITVKDEEDISDAAITVYYNGAITPPLRAGRYTVTFDIESPGFSQKKIVAGILVITLATDNITVLRTQLLYCPQNTVDNPIPVKLDIDFSRYVNFMNALVTPGRYIDLDFSDSTGTTITGQPFSGIDYGKVVSVVLPTEGLASLGDFSFACFSGITHIDLSVSDITSIGDYVFFNSTNLKNIVFPEGLKQIGDFCFVNSGLVSVTIPDHVERIGEWAYVNCHELATLTIGKSVTAIGQQAFHNTGLISVTFEGIIDTFEGSTFTFPGNLQDQYLEGGIGTYTRHDVSSETWVKL